MPTDTPPLPCPSCACPYDWRALYAALSLDAKARLAARHLADTHGCAPNGPQVVARLRELDGRDRIHRGAAWRAAREQKRVMRVSAEKSTETRANTRTLPEPHETRRGVSPLLKTPKKGIAESLSQNSDTSSTQTS